jgi:hypothetical protein
MNEAEMIQYIIDTFDDVQTSADSGNTFFFFGQERKFPFATLVANDAYEHVSNLDRPGVFRLNIGVSKQTYRSLFPESDDERGYDFTALDQIMPHPVYGRMYWVCVLNPGAATFETVQRLLAEAYERDVSKHAKARPVNQP